jgi:hypothetical protein
LESNELWKRIFNLKYLWMVLARFDYMGLVEGTTKGDLNELGKG